MSIITSLIIYVLVELIIIFNILCPKNLPLLTLLHPMRVPISCGKRAWKHPQIKDADCLLQDSSAQEGMGTSALPVTGVGSQGLC